MSMIVAAQSEQRVLYCGLIQKAICSSTFNYGELQEQAYSITTDSSNHPSTFELYFAYGKTDSEVSVTRGKMFYSASCTYVL